jgi:parallel beta-helix repeat protein
MELIVNKEGIGDYTTIQDAINNSLVNAIIMVREGIYNEHLLINKPLQLLANNPQDTIINGILTDTIIQITSNHVTIQGFTIQHSKPNSSQIENNIGILITTDYNLIKNCIFRNNSAGIQLKNNKIAMIIENQFYNNGYGIYTLSSNYHQVSNNSFQLNAKYGMYLYSNSNYNLINNNNFSRNSCGLRVKGNHNTIMQNIFYKNQEGLYLCCSATNNTVYMNTFIRNIKYDAKNNFRNNNWNKNPPLGGNYWWKYRGIDVNNDGFGDDPYIIEIQNQSGTVKKIEDIYPLLKPP